MSMDYSTYLSYREDILAWIKERLKPARYVHSLGVEQTAVNLARQYGVSFEEASLAGLLHDNAKYLDINLQRKIAQKAFPKIDFDMDYASVFHAFAGAAEAKKRYPDLITDDMYNAIAYHTTGRKKMSPLEQIIYCADFIEPNRTPFEGLDEAKTAVFSDLETGTLLILKQTDEYVLSKNKRSFPLTKEAIKYYEKHRKDKK